MRRHAMNVVYWTGLVLFGFVVALAVLQIGMGRGPAGVTVASHEYDCWGEDCYGDDRGYEQDYSSRDRNRNRGRDRGAFSPGPNDDSFNGNTVCLPGSTCYTDRRDQDR